MCRFYSGVGEDRAERERRDTPEHLDAALVWAATAGRGILTDDLRFRTCPGPQEMVQLHERER